MVSRTYVAICALLSVGFLKVIVTLIQRARSPLASVPGPWYTQWTSKVLLSYWLRGERASYVERLHQEYGPVVRLSPYEVDFSSISAAKQIHSYRNPFMKASFYERIRGSELNTDNVFSTSDYGYHSRHRRLLSGPMSKSSLKSVEPIIKGRVELTIQRMGEEMKSRGCTDVMKWWLFMATDIIGELSFGDSFRMLEIGRKTQYAEDLQKVAALTGLRISFPFLIHIASRLPIPLPLFREASDSGLRLVRYAEESIQRHKNIVAADPWNAKPTLFKKLYEAGEEGMSHTEIVAEARGYIVAGSDTTAHSLTYLVWAVCKNDAVKKRLVEEVSALPEGYTDEDTESLPYLSCVIQETLRMYAAAPDALPRVVPKGGCEVDGYWMPGDLTVTTQAWSLHRDKRTFPDPENFDPSRWEHPTREMKDAWMPFGAGVRNCIGLHLAQIELRLATTLFFRTYPNAKVSAREEFTEDDMKQKVYFLMFPKGKRCLIEGS